MPIDVFDELDLSIEDKINLSDDFRIFIKKEVRKEMAKVEIDIFDEIDLSEEDKLLLSDDFKKFITEQVSTEVAKIPMDKIIARMRAWVTKRVERTRDDLKKDLAKTEKTVEGTESSLTKRLNDLNKEVEDFKEKIRKKYDDLRSEILNQPRYEFGGYPPPGGGLPIQSGGLDDWRIIPDGDNLSIQKLVAGTWVECMAITPNQ